MALTQAEKDILVTYHGAQRASRDQKIVLDAAASAAKAAQTAFDASRIATGTAINANADPNSAPVQTAADDYKTKYLDLKTKLAASLAAADLLRDLDAVKDQKEAEFRAILS